MERTPTTDLYSCTTSRTSARTRLEKGLSPRAAVRAILSSVPSDFARQENGTSEGTGSLASDARTRLETKKTDAGYRLEDEASGLNYLKDLAKEEAVRGGRSHFCGSCGVKSRTARLSMKKTSRKRGLSRGRLVFDTEGPQIINESQTLATRSRQRAVRFRTAV